MLVVPKLGISDEWCRSAVDVDAARNARAPCFQRIQLSFREDRALHARDEFGKRADVHTDGLAPVREGFHQCGPAPGMRIENEIAGLGEGLDRGPCERRGKPGGVFVIAVREAADGLAVSRSANKVRLRLL